MFESLIEMAKNSILEKLELGNEYCYLNVLEEAEIHEGLKFYTEAAIEWWIYEDQMQRGIGNNFNADDEELQLALENIKSLYKKAARIESTDVDRFFGMVVTNVLNYLIKPTQTLKEFIYGDCTTKPVREIMLRIGYFTEYQYFKNHLSKCFANSNFEIDYEKIIPVGNFVDYIIEADMDIMMSSGPKKVLQLLRPMQELFEQFNGCEAGDYSIEALGIFFDDKGNEDVKVLLADWSKENGNNKYIDEETFAALTQDFFTGPDDDDLAINLDGLNFFAEEETQDAATNNEVESQEEESIDIVDIIEEEVDIPTEIVEIVEEEISEEEVIDEIEIQEEAISAIIDEVIDEIDSEEFTEDLDDFIDEAEELLAEEVELEPEFETEAITDEDSLEDISDMHTDRPDEMLDLSDALDGFSFEGMDLDEDEMPRNDEVDNSSVDSEELSESLEIATSEEIKIEEDAKYTTTVDAETEFNEESLVDEIVSELDVINDIIFNDDDLEVDTIENLDSSNEDFIIDESEENSSETEEKIDEEDLSFDDLDLSDLLDAIDGDSLEEVESLAGELIDEIETSEEEIVEVAEVEEKIPEIEHSQAIEEVIAVTTNDNISSAEEETTEELTKPEFEIEDFSDDFANNIDLDTLDELSGDMDKLIGKEEEEVSFNDEISTELYGLDDEKSD
jgi:hypothetical protein